MVSFGDSTGGKLEITHIDPYFHSQATSTELADEAIHRMVMDSNLIRNKDNLKIKWDYGPS